jgi:hypothetical protein
MGCKMKIINAFFKNQISNLGMHKCHINIIDGNLIINISGGLYKNIQIDDIKSTGYKKIVFCGKSKSGKNKVLLKLKLKKLDGLFFYEISEGFLLLCTDETKEDILSLLN